MKNCKQRVEKIVKSMQKLISNKISNTLSSVKVMPPVARVFLFNDIVCIIDIHDISDNDTTVYKNKSTISKIKVLTSASVTAPEFYRL